MPSKTEIVNIAVARIGVGQFVGNVETEKSQAAISARTCFDNDRNSTLRDFPWPFATAYATLNLVAGSSSEAYNLDWQYAYRYPSDCLFFRRILSIDGRNSPTPPPFKIARDNGGRLILTNEAEAQGEYTAVITDVSEFDDLAASALAWKLGASLAPGLSRIKDMAKTCLEMYEIEKSRAASRALNEGQQEEPVASELERSRS